MCAVKKHSQKTEVKISPKDGIAYRVDYEKRTVKKISGYTTDFVLNSEIEPLPTDTALNNTKVLYDFLKPEFPNAELKRGSVIIANYSIKYASHGFMIKDMSDENASINRSNFNNDFETPEAVLAFIQEDITKPKRVDEHKKAVHLGDIAKTKRIEELRKKLADEDDRLLKDFKGIVNAMVEGRAKYKETLNKALKRMPNKLAEQVKTLVHDIFKRKITKANFDTKAKKLVTTYLEASKEERERNREKKIQDKERKKNGRFIAPALEIPIYPTLNKETHTIKYETKGPTNTKYKVTKTLDEYLLMVLLANQPKAVPIVNSILRGELTEWSENLADFKFPNLPFEHPEKQLLKTSPHIKLFRKFCKDYFDTEGVETVFAYRYTKKFKRNQKVKVFMADVLQWWWGKVTNNPGEPLTVMFEDGETQYIYKHQKVIAVS